MHWSIELFIYGFLLITAIVSLAVRDLLAAVVTTTAFSFAIAIAYVMMGAVDVGFTEAVIGAGILGVFFVIFILKTSRRSLD